MEIEVGSNTIARNSSFDKFEAIEVHAEEKQMHTGDSITSKALEDALQRRYRNNHLPEQYREDLANLKKHFKETLLEYAARVENLVCRGYPHLKEINLLNTLKVENFLMGLPDQSIAYEVKIRKPQSIDDAIEWFNWHECCEGNIFKKRAEVRQIETEEYYEHTELIEENEIRKVGNTRLLTEERLDKKLEIFSREI
ncbi:unnamed protein product [Mytilus coruscus]|uniref:Retrotransposon gag domain-containing protein n=1 Tax=Mytilus coruscus TaxID=42192 RepID=A0A6J8AP23_MYTCO|nr:unnamed protein product [Mytilus coruscus]